MYGWVISTWAACGCYIQPFRLHIKLLNSTCYSMCTSTLPRTFCRMSKITLALYSLKTGGKDKMLSTESRCSMLFTAISTSSKLKPVDMLTIPTQHRELRRVFRDCRSFWRNRSACSLETMTVLAAGAVLGRTSSLTGLILLLHSWHVQMFLWWSQQLWPPSLLLGAECPKCWRIISRLHSVVDFTNFIIVSWRPRFALLTS